MTRRLPQIARRLLQTGVLLFVVYAAFGGPWRNYKTAHNHRRLVTLMHGETWGYLYGANEDLLKNLGEPYRASFDFLGMPYASTFFGVEGSDPIIAASTVTTTGSLPLGLLLQILIPLGLASVLGKVFCSHLCPMRLLFELGQMVRGGLIRLGVELPEVRRAERFGGWVLLGGIIATLSTGAAIWLFILPYVSLTASIFLYVTAGMLTGLLAVVIVWLTIDLFIAPGFFCHNLCPTGFVLENAGRWSLLRLRNRGQTPCPSGCDVCERTCPYGLSPKQSTHRPACDNCGKCAVACPQKRLSRRLSLPVIGALLLLALPSTAAAHHIKGLPHYGYFENYPQVPTAEYLEIHGDWEIGATIFNFQGMDRENADTPNDVKLYCYLYRTRADRSYVGPVVWEIHRAGAVISRFERQEPDEEAVYSTRETMPESGNYQLVAIVDGEQVASLTFHIDLGEGSINWLLIAGIALPVLLVFGLAVYGRKQKRKRRKSRAGRLGAASGAGALVLFGLTRLVHAAGEICPHCGMIDCTMEHVTSSSGDSVMIMGGLPLWLFLIGVGLIIVLSFVATEWLAPKTGPGFRRNLIKNRRVYRVMRSRWLQAIPQLFMAALLLLLIYVGLFGSRVANLTPVAVWTIWWAALVFAVLLFASVWCFVCPWDGLANLASRLRLRARVEPLSLGLHYPRWLANVYPAIALFVLLTWLELGYGVTTNPRHTAYMGLAMIGLAVLFALLFDGKRFCAHACPVGRICGIYSTVSPVEIRARNPRTCKSCTTEDCKNGNERGYPCPTGLSLKDLSSSAHCTMCTECIKSCNRHNVALNLRPFGADLRSIRTPRLDEAWLCLTLLALTLFHGLTMTPVWEDFRPGAGSILRTLRLELGVSHTVAFSLAMIAFCGAPVLAYWLACRLGAWWAARPRTGLPRLLVLNDGADKPSGSVLFRAYAYSLLPVALFYHLAHNLMHLAMEGGHIIPLLSDPMGDGSNYLGTAQMKVGHLIGEQTLWYLQIALILVGHIIGIVVAHRVAHRIYSDKRSALRSLVPMLVLMIALSVAGLWLMHVDMNMRVGRM